MCSNTWQAVAWLWLQEWLAWVVAAVGYGHSNCYSANAKLHWLLQLLFARKRHAAPGDALVPWHTDVLSLN